MTFHRHALGIMTGTSLDGIDAALVRLDGRGLAIHVEEVTHHAAPLGDAGDLLRQLASGEPLDAAAWAQAGRELGQACLEVAKDVAGGVKPDLVSVHGQTVHHAPPCSIQWIDAAVIAHGMACPVVHDLRGSDLAAGGQGAPITPLADWIMFRAADPRSVVNLGGFCNVTHLPDDSEGPDGIEAIEACDLCPCNHLLDLAALKLLDAPFDENGATACKGYCDESVAGILLERLRNITHSGRSLGSGDEGGELLDPLWQIPQVETALATLTDVIARRVLEVIPGSQKQLLLGGGGAFNKALVDAFIRHADLKVLKVDSVGIGIQAREAAAMAILGTLAMDGIPVTLPAVTEPTEPAHFDGSWCLPRDWWRNQYT